MIISNSAHGQFDPCSLHFRKLRSTPHRYYRHKWFGIVPCETLFIILLIGAINKFYFYFGVASEWNGNSAHIERYHSYRTYRIIWFHYTGRMIAGSAYRLGQENTIFHIDWTRLDWFRCLNQRVLNEGTPTGNFKLDRYRWFGKWFRVFYTEKKFLKTGCQKTLLAVWISMTMFADTEIRNRHKNATKDTILVVPEFRKYYCARRECGVETYTVQHKVNVVPSYLLAMIQKIHFISETCCAGCLDIQIGRPTAFLRQMLWMILLPGFTQYSDLGLPSRRGGLKKKMKNQNE